MFTEQTSERGEITSEKRSYRNQKLLARRCIEPGYGRFGASSKVGRVTRPSG
jgi:hypothetical protein